MADELDRITLADRIRSNYDSIFVANFLDYVLKEGGKEHPNEILLFAQSAYNVVLCTDYFLKRREGIDLLMPMELSKLSHDIHPKTRFKDVGFNKSDMFFLVGYLNDKLDSEGGSFDSHIYTSEINRAKDIDACIKLFENKRKKVETLRV